MKQKTVLFDLDGTLLPMDQDAFTKGYFTLLVQKLAPHGYDPAALVDNIWAGTAVMVANDGTRTNEEAFWSKLVHIYGEKVRQDIPLFDAFYREEFQQAKAFCGQNPKAREVVAACKKAGYPVVLATNPIFPAVATESRIRWAGLEPEDFACTPPMRTSATPSPIPPTTNISSPVWAPRQRTVSWWATTWTRTWEPPSRRGCRSFSSQTA